MATKHNHLLNNASVMLILGSLKISKWNEFTQSY